MRFVIFLLINENELLIILFCFCKRSLSGILLLSMIFNLYETNNNI